MALTLETFFGFESGTTDEGFTVAAPVTAGDTHNSVENYKLVLGTGSGHTWTCASHVMANDTIMSFYFYLTTTNPRPTLSLVIAEESKNDNYFTIKVDNDVLELTDADGTLIATSAVGVISDDTWHRMDIWLEAGANGSIIVHVDGVEVFNETNENFTPDSGVDILMRFSAHGFGANPCDVYIGAGYMYSGGTGIEDFLGDFQVIGPYQNRVNSNIGDFGDNLDVGTWQDCGETPGNDANTGKYTGVDDSGGVTTHTIDNGATPGPHGDGRVIDIGIKGASWLFRAKASAGGGTSNLWMKYGITPYNEVTTDNTAQSAMLFDGSWKNKLIVTDTNYPTQNDYFQYGFRSRGMIASDGELADAWCFLLYLPQAAVTTVHIKGGLIKGGLIK